MLCARVVPDERVGPGEKLFVGRHERGAMMQRRRDDQPVSGIIRQTVQVDGLNPDCAVYWQFDQSGHEKLCAPFVHATSRLMRPFDCNSATSQNDIAQTLTLPPFQNRSMSVFA